jgi:hypothetical protein
VTLLPRCLFNSELRVGGFAPRHLKRWTANRRVSVKGFDDSNTLLERFISRLEIYLCSNC